MPTKSKSAKAQSNRAEFLARAEAAKPELIAFIDKHTFPIVAHLVSKLRERDKLKKEAAAARKIAEVLEKQIADKF